MRRRRRRVAVCEGGERLCVVSHATAPEAAASSAFLAEFGHCNFVRASVCFGVFLATIDPVAQTVV
jgi:hypothetical protein